MRSYPLRSQTIRAEAESPEGPFVFREVVLDERGSSFWDGRATHNPQVHRIGDTFALFYIGTTYPESPPQTVDELNAAEDVRVRAYDAFRIGCAVADDPRGPWQRSSEPVLNVRPGEWDASIVTNPAVCVCADDSLLMIYRSNTPQGCRLGVARAAGLGQPFERLTDGPILENLHLEDPFIWQNRETGTFEMIAKDLSGKATGEVHAGAHALSTDGIHWNPASEAKAYSRSLRYTDGVQRPVGHLERPYVYFEKGVPSMLYFATAQPEGAFAKIDHLNKHTWITGVPLV